MKLHGMLMASTRGQLCPHVKELLLQLVGTCHLARLPRFLLHDSYMILTCISANRIVSCSDLA